jgi:hypothetical protein
VTALVLAAALSAGAFSSVSREQIADAMRVSKGYDPAATTNSGRFAVEVLLALAEAAERSPGDKPLFVGHEEWFQAFLEVRGLTAETAPVYARLAHQYGQDLVVEYRTDRVVERVVKGPALRRAMAVVVAWPAKAGGAEEYSFQDLLSRPTLQVTNHRQIRYRILAFEDRVVVDQMEGLTGCPSSGALGMLFKLIGEGSLLEYRLAVSSDGLQVSRGRARKGFFEVNSTVTVQPDGRAEKDVPADRPDLRALDTRLREPLEIRYRPFELGLY